MLARLAVSPGDCVRLCRSQVGVLRKRVDGSNLFSVFGLGGVIRLILQCVVRKFGYLQTEQDKQFSLELCRKLLTSNISPQHVDQSRDLVKCWEIDVTISETIQDRYNVYLHWKTNRKSHVSCRTAPISITFGDLEGHLKVTIWNWKFSCSHSSGNIATCCQLSSKEIDAQCDKLH